MSETSDQSAELTTSMEAQRAAKPYKVCERLLAAKLEEYEGSVDRFDWIGYVVTTSDKEAHEAVLTIHPPLVPGDIFRAKIRIGPPEAKSRTRYEFKFHPDRVLAKDVDSVISAFGDTVGLADYMNDIAAHADRFEFQGSKSTDTANVDLDGNAIDHIDQRLFAG